LSMRSCCRKDPNFLTPSAILKSIDTVETALKTHKRHH
jgi:hypothetical protein